MPVVSREFDYEGFYQPDSDNRGEGVITYNEIYAVVNSYVAALECYDRCKGVIRRNEQIHICNRIQWRFFVTANDEKGKKNRKDCICEKLTTALLELYL